MMVRSCGAHSAGIRKPSAAGVLSAAPSACGLRSSWRSTTLTIRRMYCSTPVALAWPCRNASRQSATRAPCSTIALKNSRRISMRTRASAAMSLFTSMSGISRRNCCVSPRPCRSTPTTSVSGASAGTSSRNVRTALSMSVFASSDMGADCSVGLSSVRLRGPRIVLRADALPQRTALGGVDVGQFEVEHVGQRREPLALVGEQRRARAGALDVRELAGAQDVEPRAWRRWTVAVRTKRDSGEVDRRSCAAATSAAGGGALSTSTMPERPPPPAAGATRRRRRARARWRSVYRSSSRAPARSASGRSDRRRSRPPPTTCPPDVAAVGRPCTSTTRWLSRRSGACRAAGRCRAAARPRSRAPPAAGRRRR